MPTTMRISYNSEEKTHWEKEFEREPEDIQQLIIHMNHFCLEAEEGFMANQSAHTHMGTIGPQQWRLI